MHFDATAMWVKDRASLAQALSGTPEMLRLEQSNGGQATEVKDWEVRRNDDSSGFVVRLT